MPGRSAAVLAASVLVLAACTSNGAPPPVASARRMHATSSEHPPSGPASSRSSLLPPIPPDPYPHGRLFAVSIPGGASRFVPRRAFVYLPPAARRDPTRPRPVLELLHGVPGDPSNWQDGGDVRGTMDAFAAHHGGESPIVVMPDGNGAYLTDTECVRTPSGADVEQYLTNQVPQFVISHYHGDPDRRHWAIAGLSEGGLCALMLGLRHSTGYAAIGDFSGLGAPAVNDSTDPQRTIDTLFAGSRTAYLEHSPIWLLQHNRYPKTALWLFTGVADHRVAGEQQIVAREGRTAGLHLTVVTMPGGHSWKLWMPALRHFLPWMWPILERAA